VTAVRRQRATDLSKNRLLIGNFRPFPHQSGKRPAGPRIMFSMAVVLTGPIGCDSFQVNGSLDPASSKSSYPEQFRKKGRQIVESQAKYDVVVIGAGNGGIAAACKMQKEGKKTLLIEKHNLPGGCATSFKRGRFEFDASLHELCDFGTAEDPGDTRKLLVDQFGLDIEWCRVPDVFRVIGRGARCGEMIDVALPAGRQEFFDAMVRYVPESREAMTRFYELMDEVIAALAYINASNGKTDSGYMKEHFPNFLKTAANPVNKVLRALNFPDKTCDILETYWGYIGVDADRLSFTHYMAMVQKYVTRYPYFPKLTSHGLSLALIKRFQEMGGEIWYNTTATEILFDGDAACGVRTTQGDLFAGYVLCNINPNIVYANMIPADRIPERELRLANARTLAMQLFVVYLGLNRSAEELGIRDYTIFLPDTTDSAKLYQSLSTIEGNDYAIMLCPSVVNPDESPKGTCILTLSSAFIGDAWKDVTSADYQRVKQAHAKRLIETVERKTGLVFHDCIEEIEIATPCTFARYLGAPNGTPYGYETNEWDSMMARLMMLGSDYPIRHFRFVGASGPKGDGYSSAYGCGELIARLALKDMKEGK